MTRHDHHTPIAIATLLAFLLATIWSPVPIARAESASPSLAHAQDLFQVAEFRASLDEVEVLLRSGRLTGRSLRDAYVLEARCKVALGEREEAEAAFCRALGVDRAWAPDPDFFTRDEVDVFEGALATCASAAEPPPEAVPAGSSTAWYKKPIVLGAAAGAAVLGLIAIFAGGGGGDGGEDPGGEVEPLPEFPQPPDR